MRLAAPKLRREFVADHSDDELRELRKALADEPVVNEDRQWATMEDVEAEMQRRGIK